MIAYHWIIIAGIGLGVLQVAFGVWIGAGIARRRGDGKPTSDHERAARLASDLRSLTDSVASSVRRHNAAIESIDQRVRFEAAECTAEQDSPLTQLVVGVMQQMLSANEQLRSDLNHTEEELRRTSDELASRREEARTDPLTGLPNRRALDEQIDRLMTSWRSDASEFSAMLLDIDHFKKFNDTHGHPAGDAALKAFAEGVREALRGQDVVARFGGEEFAVLMPHTTLDQSRGAVQKAYDAIHKLRVEVEGRSLALTASIGVACIKAGERGDSLITRADEALYAAKSAGRDCVYAHDGQGLLPWFADELAEVKVSQEVRAACEELRASVADLLSEPSDQAKAVR
ncbi:MAG: GGDEF domain-containing protein [Planctomycetota bacterium]